MFKPCGIFVLLLLGAFSPRALFAQVLQSRTGPSGESPQLERYRKSLADYSSGLLDMKLLVHSTVSEQFPNGKVKSHEYKSESRIRKVRTVDGVTSSTLDVRAERKFLYKLQGMTTESESFMFFVMARAVSREGKGFKLVREQEGEAVYTFPQEENCTPFLWKDNRLHPQQICGEYLVTFDKQSGALTHVAYTAAHLPIAGEKQTLNHFQFEQSFRPVSLPEASSPILLPAKVKAVYVLKDKTITVANEYEPKLK